MRKSITSMLVAMSIIFSPAFAAEINVSTAEQFNTAWLSYEAGDVIVLAEGTYALIGDKSVTRSVTIKAAPEATAKPILQGVQFILNDVCSFTFDGIKCYFDEPGAVAPTGKYFLQAVSTGIATGTIPLIDIRNSEIHGFGRGLFRADHSTNIATITSFVVENCYLWDMGRNSVGYSTIGMKTAKIANVLVKNTTIYNSPNGTWNAEQVAFPVNFVMENCNVIKTTTAAGKLIITNKTNPGSVYRIKNCIFADSHDAGTDRMQFKMADAADDVTSATHLENSILYGFKTPKIFGTLNTNTEIAVSTLAYNHEAWTVTTSPAETGFVGDPRWIVNGITSSVDASKQSDAYGHLLNAHLNLYNLPENARVEVYSFNGSALHLAQASGQISLPLNTNAAIVRIISAGKTQVLKVVR
jgi:hypothetical protein